MHRSLRLVLWAALLFTFVMAVLPHPPQLPGQPTDKIQHILAFTVLTGLAIAAWPAATWLRLLLALSGFGVLIELVQAIPALHRSSDWRDWLADTGAILAVLAIAAAIRWCRPSR
ncbi:VanZ family protein [Sphingomonas psychrotolerans]|uniref:VanZ family protein n=1 Tax=Sphingomonas psychrotolerans TaxID=1327635 RepID=A0A2K8MLE3_9SPHN|nr:hypothetical protein [Sphingomonas psychrotolerans]ATY34683.1 hypothetical protein CVN68_16300 [Sphingomonas psychrotolerans]